MSQIEAIYNAVLEGDAKGAVGWRRTPRWLLAYPPQLSQRRA